MCEKVSGVDVDNEDQKIKMTIAADVRMRRFFHADRYRTLVDGQKLELNENGASKFGCNYWPLITQVPLDQMDDAQLREYILEKVRIEGGFASHPSYLYPSRRQVLFAANTIEEAKIFARSIEPAPDYDIPIFEVFASKFWTLDSNWLDVKFDHDMEKMREYARQYWFGTIYNVPTIEERRPRLEVLIPLPAQAGTIVAYASCREVSA